METRTKGFKKTLLASSISSLLLAPALGHAQNEPLLEEIVVTGVYASQLNAVNTKRDAASVVDAISAEDIGKLPDVTIADSLQRIPGIQVQRVAGEGGPVQIRGLPNVATMLNGEAFLSATTIDSTSADFGDLPSQLFSGADVYKSPLATLSTSGISGTIDLKTRRPFDLDQGWTFSGSAEVDTGSISEETDPTVSGLVGWTNDNVGLLVSAVTTEKNLATDYNGYFDTSENGGIGAARGNGASDPRFPGLNYIVPQGFSAYNKVEERQRDGVNVSFQADLGEGFELVADYFYSQQERWNRRAGFSHNNRWQSFADYAYPTEDGWASDVFQLQLTDDDGNVTDVQDWRAANIFEARPYRMQSFTQVNYTEEMSENGNVELNYDNGGPLTGQVRVTRASAENRMRHGYGEGDMLDIDDNGLVTGPGGFVPAEYCDDEDDIVGSEGGCFAEFSPGGIDTTDFTIGYDASGSDVRFYGFDQIIEAGDQGSMTVAEAMASKDTYHIGAFSSEGNTDTEGKLNTFSSRWNYAFDQNPFITSVDFGFRQSEREVDREQFSYFGGMDATGGCNAQWKAVDQTASSPEVCNEDVAQGEMVDGEFQPYTLLPPLRIDEYTNAIWVDEFTGVTGVPGVWAIDPHTFDDTLAFQERVFGEQNRVVNPGQSYKVNLDEFVTFVQANFAWQALSGNLGVQVIDTDLFVKQNEVGAGRPHSGSNYDAGDAVTERSYTDVLPSLNLNYDLTNEIILRFGYGETMQPLDMLDWGGGKTVGRVFNEECGCMRIENVSLSGNPDLEPTRGSAWNLSSEWYFGNASLLSAAYFNVEIDSFVQGGTVVVEEPDADGVNRGPLEGGLWLANAPVQGSGGEVKGVELAAKVAFVDFLDEDTFFSDFGFDVNYTRSESSQDAIGFAGEELPFVGNSEDSYNIVGWYENGTLSARLAYNFRSPLLMTAGTQLQAYQSLYQDDYGQLDMNITWDATDNLAFYLNGSNITEEYQQTYMEFEGQKAFQNRYEARWALGARFTY